MIAPDMPKVIWADPPEIFDSMDMWRSEPGGKGVSYTRTDTIPSDPRVKALVEAVAELLDGDNWRLGRKFDPNSGNFDLSKQRDALAALKGAENV